MSVLDRVLAAISLLAFAGFLGILIWHVPRPGLVAVCIASVLLCAFDFIRSTFIRRWRDRDLARPGS